MHRVEQADRDECLDDSFEAYIDLAPHTIDVTLCLGNED